MREDTYRRTRGGVVPHRAVPDESSLIRCHPNDQKRSLPRARPRSAKTAPCCPSDYNL